MTDDEKKQLVVAVITQLKNDGTDVSQATVIDDVSGVSYVVCYDTQGKIIRISPSAFNKGESELQENIGNIKSSAISKDGIGVLETSTTLELQCKTLAGEEFIVELPPATTKLAGVMSAADKVKLNASIKNVDVSPNTDDVELDLEDNADRTTHVALPAATTENAGVMSAKDKNRLVTSNSYVINGANTLQDAINALNNIIPYEDKRSGVMVTYTDSNNAVHTYTFMSDVGFTNPTRWKSDVVNPYIDSEQPVGFAFRLSDIIDYIKVTATGDIDDGSIYSFGLCGHLTSAGKYGLQVLKDREVLGYLYLDPATLTGTLAAGNIIIEVKVNTLVFAGGDGAVYDYSQYYNRITPQLFINAKLDWETRTLTTDIAVLENKNTSNANKVKHIEKNVFEMSKELVNVTYKDGYYRGDIGVYVEDTSRCCTDKIDVVPGEKYFVTVNIGGSGVIAYLAQWNGDAWVGIADDFKANSGNAVEREYVVPEGVTHIAVCSYNTTPPTLTKHVVGDSTTFYTKDETYSRNEIDGMIANPPGGGSEVDSNFINNVETITLNVEDNAITEAVVLGVGWSGNLTNGYAHTSGNTESLEFNLPYASGDKFILEFKCDGVKNDSTDLLIAVGDTPTVKSYNGLNEFRIGLVANGGRLKIKPASKFASTITNISIGRISNDGNRTITINVGDVYSQANSMITAFWNVAIGSKNMTLSKLVNGSRNVAIGRNTLNSATSGNRNIAIGTFAMPFLTEAEENVAIGADTIYPLTKAFGCVGIGKATLSGTQKAEYCVAVGKGAMGTYNLSKDRTKCTAIGVDAGPSITDSCTHVGYKAGANVAGAKNTSIGYGSMAVGERSTVDITGEELTCIGYYSQIDNTEEAKTAKNSTAIGANTKITKSNQVVIGNANVEEVIIAGKRIIFHADGSVKWENI